MNARSLSLCVALLPVFAFGALAQSSRQDINGRPSAVPDKRLMSDADYSAFLLQVEAMLPTWETQLKNIDLENAPHLSYAQGKSIADQRDLALMEIGYIRGSVATLKHKRTVSGELALKGFLESLYDVGEELVWEEDFSGQTLTTLEKHAPELSALIIHISNEVLARVSLLEKSSCP